MAIKFNAFTGNFDIVGGTSGGSSGLGDKYVRTTRFEIINSGTSGTVTLPANSEVVLDDFGGTTDAVVAQSSGGKPTMVSAITSSGSIVATTFDSSGNWSLTGTPSSYPVAILYRVRQQLTNFDSTSSNIWGNGNIETNQTSVVIDVFTSSGTWTKPSGAKTVKGYLVSGGSGGGSGRKGAAGTVRCGGGAGASGSFVMFEADAALLSATETITIGAGGSGGASVTTNSTNGNDGTSGGETSFGTRYRAPVASANNSRGRGGTNAAGTGGTTPLGTVSPWNFVASAGAAASTSGGAGSAPTASLFLNPNSGGSGGGITSGDVASAGGAGGGVTSAITGLSITGGTAGLVNSNGGTGNSSELFTGFSIGSGGGGGGSSVVGDAGNGGNGVYGSGGGGGGAAVDDVGNSGAGGDGGDGVAIIFTYF
jgi:hypothetical protein